MKYENPIMDIFQFDRVDVLTVSGDVPSDGTIEDGNQLPETEW